MKRASISASDSNALPRLDWRIPLPATADANLGEVVANLGEVVEVVSAMAPFGGKLIHANVREGDLKALTQA
jgi:hypothetical protein